MNINWEPNKFQLKTAIRHRCWRTWLLVQHKVSELTLKNGQIPFRIPHQNILASLHSHVPRQTTGTFLRNVKSVLLMKIFKGSSHNPSWWEKFFSIFMPPKASKQVNQKLELWRLMNGKTEECKTNVWEKCKINIGETNLSDKLIYLKGYTDKCDCWCNL